MFSSKKFFKTFVVGIVAFMFCFATDIASAAQPQVPTIDIELPFDLAPIIAAVMALAVLVLILISGPRISLQFAKRALRAIGNIF